MRIIQVQTQAEAAGAQRISDMLGEGLRARGHDIRTVFMYRKTDVYDHDPHAVFIASQPPRGILGQARAALGLIAWLRREKPDAVITFQYWGNVFGAIGGWLGGVPCIIANQSGTPVTGGLPGIAMRLDGFLGRRGWYHHNIVNSRWTERQFAPYPEGYRRRLRLIEHGVIAPKQRFDKAGARQRFGLPEGVPLILQTGRLTVQKNQDALVRAMAHLPGVHVAIAGIGPLSGLLDDIARETGVSDRLHMLGEVSPGAIPELLAAGDLFAFPSTYETFGLSVVEAAIAGLPVVANDIEVLREVLTDDHGNAAAVFTDAGDPQVFAAALRQVLEDGDMAARLVEAGRSLGEKYAVEGMCLGYERLLPGMGA